MSGDEGITSAVPTEKPDYYIGGRFREPLANVSALTPSCLQKILWTCGMLRKKIQKVSCKQSPAAT